MKSKANSGVQEVARVLELKIMINVKTFKLYLKYPNFLFGGDVLELSEWGVKFLIRPRTYDIYDCCEVFGYEDYLPSFNLPKVERILDLGASIGTFSIWAVKKFNPKKVLAVEMEKNNFDKLVQNVELNGLGGIISPLQSAVYSISGNVGVKLSNYHVDAHELNPDGSGIKALTLKDLVSRMGGAVDFLKMDIEGSERFLLTDENKELFKKQIKYVVVESHDKPGYSKHFPMSYFSELGFKCKKRHQLFKRAIIVEAMNIS